MAAATRRRVLARRRRLVVVEGRERVTRRKRATRELDFEKKDVRE